METHDTHTYTYSTSPLTGNSGNAAMKTAPPSSPLRAWSSPPCARMIRRAIVSPSPAPPVRRFRDDSPR